GRLHPAPRPVDPFLDVADELRVEVQPREDVASGTRPREILLPGPPRAIEAIGRELAREIVPRIDTQDDGVRGARPEHVVGDAVPVLEKTRRRDPVVLADDPAIR